MKAAGGIVCGVNSLLMSPAPRATNEPRPAALIDVKKLETPRSASCLPAASPEPLPLPAPPAALLPFEGLLSISTNRQGKGSGLLAPHPHVPLDHSSLKRWEADMLWRGWEIGKGKTDQGLKITVQGQRSWC